MYQCINWSLVNLFVAITVFQLQNYRRSKHTNTGKSHIIFVVLDRQMTHNASRKDQFEISFTVDSLTVQFIVCAINPQRWCTMLRGTKQ